MSDAPSGPLAVIVTGLPGSGKTLVARRIAAAHGLPLACKDEFKELLFDTLGWRTASEDARAWSRRLGRAAAGALLLFLRAHAAAGLPCVIESNVPPEAASELLAVHSEHPLRFFQVVCRARGDVLYARFCARAGTRHPGHGDDALIEELRPMLLAGAYAPLAIGGALWELDTTDWESLCLDPLHAAIGAALTVHAAD